MALDVKQHDRNMWTLPVTGHNILAFLATFHIGWLADWLIDWLIDWQAE